MSKPEKLRVVLVEPGRYAREAEIDNTLKAEQEVVGGLIDAICPWPEDKTCLILNDEGKVIPLEPNRALPEYEDVVFGTFFICGDGGDDFCSLTPEQVKRYEALYHDPQLFYPLGDSIFVENCSPERYRQVMNPEEHREKTPPPKQTSTPER